MTTTKKYLDSGFEDASSTVRAAAVGPSVEAGYVPRCVHNGGAIKVTIGGADLAGAQKSNLKIDSAKTLLINCTGAAWSNPAKPMLVTKHRGLLKYAAAARVDEIVIDWPDMGVPKLHPKFWGAVVRIIRRGKFERVVTCCLGGHGRTGTSLAALLIADGASAEEAVAIVRDKYCGEAVETRGQEEYLDLVEEVLAEEREERKAKRRKRAKRARKRSR